MKRENLMNISKRNHLGGRAPCWILGALWILLVGLSPITAWAVTGFDIDQYEIYYGDFNGDGDDGDVYFHGREKIILLHGSIITPIEIKGASGFAYYQNGDGSPEALDVPKSDLQHYSKVVDHHGYTLSDLDDDGHLDIAVRLSSVDDEQVFLYSSVTGNFQRYHSFELDYWIDDSYPETLVGKQPYSLSVNGKGDATLNVPLEVIPGVAGFAPSLAINYNSSDTISRLYQSRPGATLGYGWSLSGISKIRRCVVGQPSSASIQLNNNDSLCLDGEPLVLVDGSHFSGGALYRTKVHSNLLVEAYLASSGSLAFLVKHPDGTEVTYENSTRNDGSAPYQWLQTKATSADGNAIYYAYNAESSGTETIKSISYSGAKIQFSYKEGRSDAQSVPIGGVTQTQDSLLSKITVLMNDVKVRDYYLLNETVSGKNRLKGIQQCGYDISGSEQFCLKPTEFEWRNDVIPTVGALLTGIHDSLGADHKIEYGQVSSTGTTAGFSENPFNGGASYTNDSQTLSGSGVLRYVVSKLRQEDGDPSTSGIYVDTTFRYQGQGRTSTNNWGFIGFRSQRITDSLGKSTYIQYRMDYPHFGAVASERTYKESSSSELLRRTDYIYEASSVSVNADENIFVDNPTIKRIVNPIIADGATLGAKYTTYNREWSSQEYSAENGGSFESSFLTEVNSVDKYYGYFKIYTPSSSTWGDYWIYDYDEVSEEKLVSSTVEFNNRTSNSRWLIGFVENTATTKTNLQYEATNNNTSYTQSASYTPWNDTMRNRNVTVEPFVGAKMYHTYSYNGYGNTTEHRIFGGAGSGRTKNYSGYVENRYLGTSEDIAEEEGGSYTHSKGGYDLRFGYPQSSTDADGRDTGATYDALGRKKRSTDPFGNVTTRTFKKCNSSNCYGNHYSAAYVEVTTRTGKATTRKFYDLNNREVRSSKQGFDGAYIRTDTEYDNHGRVHRVSLPYREGASAQWITYQYDDQNRVKKVTRPNGSIFDVNYTANGSVKRAYKTVTETVKDMAGNTTATKVTKQEFNLLGHMVKTTQALGSPDEVVTIYDYTAHDKLDTVTVYDDGTPKTVTSYEYDAAGNMTKVVDSNSGAQTFQYYADGNIGFHFHNGNFDFNNFTEFRYDDYGRLIRKTNFYSDGAEENIEWVWGAPNAPTKLHYLTKDSSYREVYAYNSDSKVKGVFYEADYKSTASDPDYDVDTWSGENKTLQVDYDYYSNGDLKSKSYDEGTGYVYKNTYQYEYGYQARLQAEAVHYYESGGNRYTTDTIPQATVKTINTVNAFGNATDILYGNGVSTTQGFDQKTGFLTGIETRYFATVYQNNHYEWLSDGALDAKTAYTSSVSASYRKEKYEYDELERLVKVNTQASSSSIFKTQNYSYDDLGNLTSQTSTYGSDIDVTNYDYDYNSFSGVNTVDSYKVEGTRHSLWYNATGSVTRYSIEGETDKFIDYNLSKQPTKIVVGSGLNDSSPEVLEKFRYNASGKLSYRETHWQEDQQEKSESAYYFGNVEITGSYTKINVEGDVVAYFRNGDFDVHEFLHRDYQGSVEAVTYLNGSAPSLSFAQAFGVFGTRESKNWKYDLRVWSSEFSGILNDETHNNLGYTGHVQLDRSGFIHMQGRLYDPVLGRFLSPDPVVLNPANSQNWNRYSYVLNNPTKYVDPTGLYQVPICELDHANGNDCPNGISKQECITRDGVVEGWVCNIPDHVMEVGGSSGAEDRPCNGWVCYAKEPRLRNGGGLALEIGINLRADPNNILGNGDVDALSASASLEVDPNLMYSERGLIRGLSIDEVGSTGNINFTTDSGGLILDGRLSIGSFSSGVLEYQNSNSFTFYGAIFGSLTIHHSATTHRFIGLRWGTPSLSLGWSSRINQSPNLWSGSTNATSRGD